MMYLKSFKENKNYKDELAKFCIGNLPFLLDKDYKIRIIDINNKEGKYYRILFKKHTKINFLFKWNDIKDEFIPFLYLLSKNYLLSNCFGNDPICIHTGNNNHYFKPDDLLNDNIDSKLIGNIIIIEIYVK